MLLAIAAIVTVWVFGIPLAVLAERSARGLRLAGLAFLYGSGAVYGSLFVLAICRIEWTAALATVLLVVASVVALALSGRVRETRLQPSSPKLDRRAWFIDAVTLYSAAAYAMFVSAARPWEWDFWAIWGLKARVFFGHGGIDWHFLLQPKNEFAHPDYPLLFPLNLDYLALLGGAWDDRWLGLIHVAFAAALLLLVRDEARRDAGDLFGAAITLAVSACALSPYAGMADGPFLVFAGAALLMIRRAVQSADAFSMRHGAILLGLAASTKNEGIALVGVVVVALLLTDRRRVRELWPALAILAPWLVARAAFRLPTDVASGAVASRIIERLPHSLDIAVLLGRHLADPAVWVLVGAAVLVAGRATWKHEQFILAAIALQLAVYVAVYFATPYGVEWHIATSWPRLVRQLLAPLICVVMIALARLACGDDDRGHAQARSDL